MQSFTFPMKTLLLFSCTATDALPLLAKKKEKKKRERDYIYNFFTRKEKQEYYKINKEKKERNDQIEEEPTSLLVTDRGKGFWGTESQFANSSISLSFCTYCALHSSLDLGVFDSNLSTHLIFALMLSGS